MIVVFGLDDCDWNIRFVIQDVVGEFRLPSCDHLPADVNLALGEVHLPTYLGIVDPAGRGNCRSDEFRADVSLAEVLLVHLYDHLRMRDRWLVRLAMSSSFRGIAQNMDITRKYIRIAR